MSQTNGASPITAHQLISKPRLEKIIEAACVHFGCTEEDLKNQGRSRDIVYRRKICYHLIKEHVYISDARIGQRFGGISLSTVNRQAAEIDAQKAIYANIRQDLAKIMAIADNLA